MNILKVLYCLTKLPDRITTVPVFLHYVFRELRVFTHTHTHKPLHTHTHIICYAIQALAPLEKSVAKICPSRFVVKMCPSR